MSWCILLLGCIRDIQRKGTVSDVVVVSSKVLADNALKVTDVSVAPVAKVRTVRFKDGSFKEYPVGFHYDLPVLKKNLGGDSRLDNFAAEVVTGFSAEKFASNVFVPPVLDLDDKFFRDLGYEVVGHGHKFDERCNLYAKTTGCPCVENHLDHVGLVPTHKCHHHCYNYRCPDSRLCALDCYFWGACVREADHIDQRLLWLAEKLGKPVQVGTISVPKSLYGAPEEIIRKWTVLAARNRGLEEDNLICHPMRYRFSYKDVDGKFHLAKFYYAHHYHFCGIFRDDYEVCRNCEHYNPWGAKSVRGNTGYGNHGGKACLDCSGFEGLTRRLRLKDGFIMKVFDKRENFFKTIAYELSHSGFAVGAKRVHVSSWYGRYAHVKLEYKRRKLVCPESACKREFVTLHYSGNYEIVKDAKSPFYQRDSWMPYMEDGKVVWHEAGGSVGV